MSNNITVWAGSLVPLVASQGDSAAISASITLIPPTGANLITTKPYEVVEGKTVADLTITAPDVTEETVYSYYISENIPDEPPLVYPDPKNCSGGDCELPTITVCVLGGSN